MERILRKQYLLTGYLECLLKKHLSPESGRELTLKIITPEDPKQRGSQLSLVFSKEVSDVHKKLEKRAIVVRDHFCLNNFTPLNQYDFLLTFQSDLKQVVVRCICLCNPPEILTQTANMFLSVRLPSPERHPDLPGAPLQFLLGCQEVRGVAQKHRRREGLNEGREYFNFSVES